ncbi:MAG: tetratricopeptide repeat protein [Candidatus Sedimenticola sp. (ex Thyasira tokunagai)]
MRLYEEGLKYQQLGNLSKAEKSYRKAIKHEKGFVQALTNLGNVFIQQGRVAEAESVYRQAQKLLPDNPMILSNIGNALQLLGKNEQAISCLNRAIVSDPKCTDAYNNLGNALKGMGRLDEAVIYYKKAISHKPKIAQFYMNLGVVLKEQGLLFEALEMHQQAIRLNPKVVEAFYNLGNTQKELGQLENALVSYERAIQLKPNYKEAHSNRNYTLNFISGLSRIDVYKKHLELERASGNIKRLSAVSSKHSKSRIRIGYLSPDFKTHSVAYFFEPLLRAHDRDTVEIFCYYNGDIIDQVTERLIQETEHWRSIVKLENKGAADLIRKDRIDILVDLAGHTANTKLLVFMYKPAPIQITWLGYPNTTGLSSIDYRFTDEISDPTGDSDDFYSEQLIRLPHGFLSYSGNLSMGVNENLPSLDNGYITFCSFNNLTKVTPVVIKVWSRILNEIPDSRLLLKSKQLSEPNMKTTVVKLFEDEGVDRKRLELRGRLSNKDEHLSFYDNVDICLDPFPYNGTTTTCEALWMGVPVITWKGDRHVSRVGASILTHIGLSECIASDVDEYVQKAIDYAKNLERLSELRRGLRKQMCESDLCDAKKFAQSVEEAYRKIVG